MRKNFKFITLMLALVLSLTAAAFGQETTGAIEGTVTDTTGARVPGVTVTATGINQGFSRTVKTDEEGFYRIQQVPPGQYRVTTSGASGFADTLEDAVAVTLGRNTPVNFSLRVTGSSAEVTITGADTPAIDPSTAGRIQTTIDQRTIDLLPRTPNFSSLLTISPGVRNEPLSGGFQIDGASGSENTFILDGQEVTNFRTGVLNVNNNIPGSFVQEIQVKTSGFEAQFGGATGGVVNVVTRGGGNDFRGEFGVEFEPSKFQARGRQILGADDTRLFYIQPQRAGGLNFFPTGTFSGPIIPRHLWFFASTAPQFLETQQTFFTENGQSISYEQKERRDYAFLRLDGQILNNLRLSGTYTYNPRVINGTFPTFNEVFGATSLSQLPTREARQQLGGRVPASNVTGQVVFTPTNNLAINVRAGRGYLNEKINNYGIPNTTRIVCRTTGPNCAAGLTSGPPNFLTQRDISIRKTFDVDANYLLSNFGGRHQFAGGYQRNAISNDVNEGYVGTGEVRLFYGQNFANNAGTPIGVASGALGYGYLQDFGTSGIASSVNEGIFIQDSWQPINRLTLNIGIRAERENVPSFSEAGVPIKFDFADKLAPRFGFSYDVTGNSKFVIRGSFGRFFDRFKYELPRGSFGGDVFFRYYFPIPVGSTTPFTTFTRAYALANQFRTPLNFRVPSNSSDPNFNTVDPDLKPVRQTEYTIGAQFEVVKDLVLEVNYKRKKLDRTIEDVGVPDPITGSETYFIANPGFGIVADSLIPGTPGTPKAQRQYDALEVNLNRRFTSNYYVNASYTYSRLFGNYGGLANSDEGGRTSPNVNRVFDLPFESFTASGVPNNGLLSTDRPHVFKAFGGYTVNYNEDSLPGRFGRFFGISSDHSTDIALNFIAQSGTPVTSRVDLIDVATVVLNERGDLGRTEFFTETGFALKHRYRFGRDGRLALEGFVNILNVFNQANELARNDLISLAIFDESAFGLTSRVAAIQAIFAGNGVRDDIQRLLDTPGYEIDKRYNQPNLFQAPRRVRFGFRFVF